MHEARLPEDERFDLDKLRDTLGMPAGNRLERLSGSRRGQHSIRINDQYRVCFRWEDGYADDVEIIDYH
ncbi:MAG: type II toxin-antitoxin system RelE/ParE family toxin [Gemmatimonadales bacterium]